MNAAKAEHGSFHSGNVIAGRNVTIFDPHAPKPAAATNVPAKDPSPAPAKPDARVRLIKEGDIVTAIEIRCACGELIHLDCEY
jgi:hypothetical protein